MIASKMWFMSEGHLYINNVEIKAAISKLTIDIRAANDPQAEQAKKYPAYWRELPENWAYIDTYRIGELFPVDDKSGRIMHARKKLLVPGVRTGGKSMRKDILEAVSTLQAWLADNPETE